MKSLLISNLIQLSLCAYVSVKYDVVLEGLDLLKQGACLIGVKHNSLEDIPVESYALKSIKRNGNWIMKDSLCFKKFLQWGGGIPISRHNELKSDEIYTWLKNNRNYDKNTNNIIAKLSRERLEQLKNINLESVFLRCEELYASGEIVIYHPEGTRSPGIINTLHMDFFRHAFDFEKKNDVIVNKYLMGIEKKESCFYVKLREFNSCDVKEARKTLEELCDL